MAKLLRIAEVLGGIGEDFFKNILKRILGLFRLYLSILGLFCSARTIEISNNSHEKLSRNF